MEQKKLATPGKEVLAPSTFFLLGKRRTKNRPEMMGDFILGYLQYLYLFSGLKCFFFALSNEVHICVLSRFNLCHPMACSLPGSSVRENLQARIMEWVAMPSSRGSS